VYGSRQKKSKNPTIGAAHAAGSGAKWNNMPQLGRSQRLCVIQSAGVARQQFQRRRVAPNDARNAVVEIRNQLADQPGRKADRDESRIGRNR
jgi:hypothetical protein